MARVRQVRRGALWAWHGEEARLSAGHALQWKRRARVAVAGALLWVVIGAVAARAAPFQTFDDFPPTGASEAPAGGGGWTYSSSRTNPYETIPRCGFWNLTPYTTDSAIRDQISYYFNTYNSVHMGFATYGYLEVDAGTAVSGRSLRLTVTGGKTLEDPADAYSSVVTVGMELTSKEEYLELVGAGYDPIGSARPAGHPTLYFGNNSSTSSPVPFAVAQGANRLSFYVRAPATLRNDGESRHVAATMSVGPYSYIPKVDLYPPGHPQLNDLSEPDVTGHWYHELYTNGGDWAHVLLDGHPVHNNSFSDASLYHYPGRAIRDLGVLYFNNLFRWYVTFRPYTGIGTAAYPVWLDEVVFTTDSEPQNDETIASPAVTFRADSGLWEVSFNDKYKSEGYGYGTYELRYAFAAITNASFAAATPALIQAAPQFEIEATDTGRFRKYSSGYNAVWAAFRLQPSDEASVGAGTTVYFALKDVSQQDGDGLDPAAGPKTGRDYRNHADMFDYAGDQPALLLIKRIEFAVPATVPAVTVAGGRWAVSAALLSAQIAALAGRRRAARRRPIAAARPVGVSPSAFA
ncbi:MAG: hypothetical protein HYV63_10790 [Candidatus Schekmanbacteria bacterium]|nr:hypothetical protein [Candidatus Schekmanbacteria bacterium]